MSFGAEILFARGGQAEILYADPLFRRPCLEKRYFNGRKDTVFWQAEIDAMCDLRAAGVQVPELLATDSSDCSMVMQRIEGRTLHNLMEYGHIWDCAHASRLLDRLCDQVGLAHRAGWLHLDLSPDNVVVDSGENVWLIDFALAQRTGSAKQAKFGKKPYMPKYYWETPNEGFDWHAVGVIADELSASLARRTS